MEALVSRLSLKYSPAHLSEKDLNPVSQPKLFCKHKTWVRLLEDAGVCHYMAVFRHSVDGSLHCFDFGPPGGDIVLPPRAERARDLFLRRSPRRAVNGEIRVSKVCLALWRSALGTTECSCYCICMWLSLLQLEESKRSANDTPADTLG